MKRAVLGLVTVLLLLAVTGTQLVPLGKANPMHYYHSISYQGLAAPDQYTEPPAISLLSPENDTVYGVDAISLSLNVSVGDSSTASSLLLDGIYYEVDWQSNITSIYEPVWDAFAYDATVYRLTPKITEFSGAINVTGIPDGNHTLTVYAIERGLYESYVKQDPNDYRIFVHYYNKFKITGSSLVSFSVDTTTPVVSVFSPENVTYYSPEVLLNFTVSENSSRMFYSLDGQENVTITGNTTLSSLPSGEHNVTVYATDVAGHTGASETIYFNIAEPFPTVPVATASLTSAILVSAGLLVYFKKRKH